MPTEASEGRVAVHVRHHEVEHDQDRPLPQRQLHGLGAVRDRHRLEAGLQHLAHEVAHPGVIVGDEREGRL